MITTNKIKKIYFEYLCSPSSYMKENIIDPEASNILKVMKQNNLKWTKEYQDRQYINLNKSENIENYITTFNKIFISSKNFEQIYKLIKNTSVYLLNGKKINQTLLKHYYDLILFDVLFAEEINKNKFKSIFDYLSKENKNEFNTFQIMLKKITNLKQDNSDYRYIKIISLLKSIDNVI